MFDNNDRIHYETEIYDTLKSVVEWLIINSLCVNLDCNPQFAVKGQHKSV